MSTTPYTRYVLYPLIAVVSLVSAFLLRFELSIPPDERRLLYIALLFFPLLKLAAFHLCKLTRGHFQTVTSYDLLQIFAANLGGSLLTTIVTLILIGSAFSRSVYLIDFIICFLLTSGFRLAVHLSSELRVPPPSSEAVEVKNVLIYGAGASGLSVARDLRRQPHLGYRVLGFLDDERSKHRTQLMGIPILGSGREAGQIVQQLRRRNITVHEVVIAMPSATSRQLHEAAANCRAAQLSLKTVPGIRDLLSGKGSSGPMRDFDLDDLLGRKEIRLQEQAITADLAGKTVMVTGGCGSIGSELCRQISRFAPKRVIIFDQSESDLFMLDRELRANFPAAEIIPEIGDIRNFRRLDEVMSRWSVNSVFHAAAYKHVPMMERNILEAAENNVIGTYNVARAAHENRVSQFLMISSDKAVNPTSVMGVTKRIAELLLSAMPLTDKRTDTRFVSVRFGNVLGSNGSVVPIFQRQIAAGGPVTVTHPEMRRYFMTIPEAVQLVLQASTMGKGSEVFVLDMGEPVRIVDLARNMIELCGFVPDKDIEIRFSGLRPGEKLFEEIATADENTLPTYHEKIKIFQSRGPSSAEMLTWLDRLEELMQTRNDRLVMEHMLTIVPEYIPEEVRHAAKEQLVKA